jgi:hypothetical protein
MTTPSEPTATPVDSTAASRAFIQRIDALEEANRKLKRQGMLLVVITAVLLGVGLALVVTAARRGMPGLVPDVVESHEFVLRDKEGRVRGVWGSDDQGAIRLVLQDHRSRSSIKLNLLEDGSSGLTFSDSAGTARMVLAVLPDQTVNMVLGDSRGVARTVLGLNPNGGSTLAFADAGGSTRSGIGVDSRGRPMLSIANTGESAEPDSTR